MKYTLILINILILNLTCFCQSLGGYQIIDFLESATHPTCVDATNKYIVGLPNDSIWANITNGNTMIGMFSSNWINGNGDEMLIETGYTDNKYDLRLLLSDGSYSQLYTTDTSDFILLNSSTSFDWISESGNCVFGNSSGNLNHKIIPLDFDADFGLTSTGTVVGIEVNFNYTNESEIAGVYITGEAIESEVANIEDNIDFTISPIPFSDHINIVFSNSITYEIGLFNLLGEKLHAASFTGSSYVFSVSELASGTYFLKVKSSDGSRIEQIIKK